VITEIMHDSPQGIFVSGILEPGTIRRSLGYGGMNTEMLDVFMDGFEHCEQVWGEKGKS
jgi:hypothetical protein